MITLRLLGGLTLENPDGSTGRAGQKRRLALLALLASRPGDMMSRDKLLGMFWPESAEDEGRHRLSSALYDIRKALGEAILVTRGDDVALGTNVVRTDVADFERAVSAGEWRTALELYRGPFLDGIYLDGAGEFEHWVDGRRAELARMYERCLEELARLATADGDSVGAVEAWHRLAELQPLSDRAALALMQALEAAGNRAAAIRHAELHAGRLQSELGATPDARVTALASAMKRIQGSAPVALAANTPPAIANPAAPLPQPVAEVAPRARHRGLLAVGAMVLAIAVLGISWSFGRRNGLLAGEVVVVGDGPAEITAMTPAAQAAWREGNVHAHAGRFDAAVESFLRATEIDSTAALAHHHAALAMLWADAPGTALDAHEKRALALSGTLPPYERLLVRAYAAWRTADETAEPLARRATTERPDHPDGWIQLGEVLFHYNPVLGRRVAHARHPFEQALALDPTNHAALWHLALLSVHEGRKVDFFDLTDRLLANRPDEPRRRQVETLRTIARGEPAATRRAIAELRDADENILVEIASRSAVFLHDLDAATAVYQLLSAPGRSPYARRIGNANLLYLELARGNIDEAIARLPDLAQIGDHDGRRFAITMIVSLGLLPDDDPRRVTLARGALTLGGNISQPSLRLALTLMRIAVGDTVGARTEIAALRRGSPTSEAVADTRLANVIEAYFHHNAGRHEEAFELLQAAYSVSWFGIAGLEPGMAKIFERWLMAETLQALGRHAEADGWFAGFTEHTPADLALLGPVARRRTAISSR